MIDVLKSVAMIAELDAALHGASYARDASPREVWDALINEVRVLVEDKQQQEGESA